MSTDKHQSHLRQYLKHHKAVTADQSSSPQRMAPPLLSSTKTHSQKDTQPGQGGEAKGKAQPDVDHLSDGVNSVVLKNTTHGTDHKSRKPRDSDLKENTGPMKPKPNKAAVKKKLPTVSYASKIKASFQTMPGEILLQIFSRLDVADLLVCCCVCKYWKQLAEDNVIWQRLHRKYVNKSSKNNVKLGHTKWKKECIQSCKESRDTKVLSLLKKLDPFTGLPANTDKALQKLDIEWKLCLVDSDHKEFFFTQRDVFYHRMSISVRWFSLELPPMRRVRKLRIYAASPIFCDKKGNPYSNSAKQMSLIYEIDFVWSRLSEAVVVAASDDVVDVRIVPPLLVATWKDGGELAFVTAGFHRHRLLDRCFGGFTVPGPSAAKKGSGAALYGFNCTIELRNQRASIWSEQFRSIYFSTEEKACGSATLHLISPESNYRHTPVPKKLDLPWKTDLFKNILKGLCVMDLTLSNEDNAPVWCLSTPIKVSAPEVTTVTYDYDGDYHFVDHVDNFGKVHMELVWEQDIGQYMLSCLDIHVSLGALPK